MLLLLLATAQQKALGLHKNLVRSKNGKKGASCADAKSGGCKSEKLGGKRIGLVDCCRGKEQCGGRVTWHSGHGRSENGSETMHKTCCVC